MLKAVLDAALSDSEEQKKHTLMLVELLGRPGWCTHTNNQLSAQMLHSTDHGFSSALSHPRLVLIVQGCESCSLRPSSSVSSIAAWSEHSPVLLCAAAAGSPSMLIRLFASCPPSALELLHARIRWPLRVFVRADSRQDSIGGRAPVSASHTISHTVVSQGCFIYPICTTGTRLNVLSLVSPKSKAVAAKRVKVLFRPIKAPDSEAARQLQVCLRVFRVTDFPLLIVDLVVGLAKAKQLSAVTGAPASPVRPRTYIPLAKPGASRGPRQSSHPARASGLEIASRIHLWPRAVRVSSAQ